MTDSNFPDRLADSANDDFVRGILRAGKRDAAEPAQAQVAVAKYLLARGSAGTTEAHRGGGAPRLLTKVGGVALASAICFGLATWSSIDKPPRPLSAPEESAPSGSTLAAPVAPLATTLETPTVRVSDLPSAAIPAARPSSSARERVPASTGEVAAEPPAATGSLRDELALVEAARASLTQSDPEDCLRILDGYGRRFGAGVLAHEVAAMRIEALVAHGEPERARALGEAFLTASPSSPYATRIRSILARLEAH